jgi:hypothetical protein
VPALLLPVLPLLLAAAPAETHPEPEPPRADVPAVTGLDPLVVGLAQFGAGALFTGGMPGLLWAMGTFAAPVCWPCAAGFGLATCGYICLGPAVTAVIQGVVGDTLGPSRGALLWPIVSAYGAACGVLGLQALVFAILGVVELAVLAPVLAEGRFDEVGPLAQSTWQSGAPYVQASIIVTAILSPLILAAVPALFYPLSAEPKRPGDRGQLEWPGLLSPRHPAPVAMAY